MIHWKHPDPPVQLSKCKRYMVMHATEEFWIAYWCTDAREWVELGTFRDESHARGACEQHAHGLSAA